MNGKALKSPPLKKMIDWGIDGIQTDKPEELISFLNDLN